MSSDKPKIVGEVQETASSLDENIEELQEFQSDIDAYIEQLEGMESTEREAFYEHADSILQEVENAETVNDLLALADRVEDAIRAPLQQVALKSLEEYLDALNPDLRDSTRQEIRDNLSNRIPQDLKRAAETYQEITPTVRDLPDTALNPLSTSIEETPSDLLSPNSDIKPRVDATKQRVDDLQELEKLFETAGDWAPAIDFVGTKAFYKRIEATVPTDAIETHLQEMNKALINVSGAPVSIPPVVKTELSERLATADISTLGTLIRDIKGELTDIQDLYQKTDPYFEDLESFGTEEGVFEGAIDDLLVEKSQLALQEYSKLNAISEDLEDLDHSLEEFMSEVHQRLKAQLAMVKVLEGEESSDTPNIHMMSGSTLTLAHVKDNLLQALKDCQAHQEWIIGQLQVDDDDVEQEQLLEIWQRLSQGEEIPLTEDVQDAVMNLANQLSLSVVLRSE